MFDLLLGKRDTGTIRKAHTVCAPPNVPPSLAGSFLRFISSSRSKSAGPLASKYAFAGGRISAVAVHHPAEIMTEERVHKGGKYQSNLDDLSPFCVVGLLIKPHRGRRE